MRFKSLIGLAALGSLVCLDTTVYTKDFPCIDVCITVGSAGDECWHLGQITPVTNDIMLPSFCQVAVHEPCNSILWKSSLNHFSCKYLFDVAPYIPNILGDSSCGNLFSPKHFPMLHSQWWLTTKCYWNPSQLHHFQNNCPPGCIEKRQNSNLCSYHISRSPFSQLT